MQKAKEARTVGILIGTLGAGVCVCVVVVVAAASYCNYFLL